MINLGTLSNSNGAKTLDKPKVERKPRATKTIEDTPKAAIKTPKEPKKAPKVTPEVTKETKKPRKARMTKANSEPKLRKTVSRTPKEKKAEVDTQFGKATKFVSVVPNGFKSKIADLSETETRLRDFIRTMFVMNPMSVDQYFTEVQVSLSESEVQDLVNRYPEMKCMYNASTNTLRYNVGDLLKAGLEIITGKEIEVLFKRDMNNSLVTKGLAIKNID